MPGHPQDTRRTPAVRVGQMACCLGRKRYLSCPIGHGIIHSHGRRGVLVVASSSESSISIGTDAREEARSSRTHGGNAAFCSRRPRKINSAAPSCAEGTAPAIRTRCGNGAADGAADSVGVVREWYGNSTGMVRGWFRNGANDGAEDGAAEPLWNPLRNARTPGTPQGAPPPSPSHVRCETTPGQGGSGRPRASPRRCPGVGPNFPSLGATRGGPTPGRR